MKSVRAPSKRSENGSRATGLIPITLMVTSNRIISPQVAQWQSAHETKQRTQSDYADGLGAFNFADATRGLGQYKKNPSFLYRPIASKHTAASSNVTGTVANAQKRPTLFGRIKDSFSRYIEAIPAKYRNRSKAARLPPQVSNAAETNVSQFRPVTVDPFLTETLESSQGTLDLSEEKMASCEVETDAKPLDRPNVKLASDDLPSTPSTSPPFVSDELPLPSTPFNTPPFASDDLPRFISTTPAFARNREDWFGKNVQFRTEKLMWEEKSEEWTYPSTLMLSFSSQPRCDRVQNFNLRLPPWGYKKLEVERRVIREGDQKAFDDLKRVLQLSGSLAKSPFFRNIDCTWFDLLETVTSGLVELSNVGYAMGTLSWEDLEFHGDRWVFANLDKITKYNKPLAAEPYWSTMKRFVQEALRDILKGSRAETFDKHWPRIQSLLSGRQLTKLDLPAEPIFHFTLEEMKPLVSQDERALHETSNKQNTEASDDNPSDGLESETEDSASAIPERTCDVIATV